MLKRIQRVIRLEEGDEGGGTDFSLEYVKEYPMVFVNFLIEGIQIAIENDTRVNLSLQEIEIVY